MNIDIQFVGADAIMLYFADDASPQLCQLIGAAATKAEALLGESLIDLVPSYTSLLVIFDPLHSSHLEVARRLRQGLTDPGEIITGQGREIRLPVYYAPESGQDLEAVARAAKLATDEVIALHSGRHYHVYAIGFAPGFAYLGDVDERIAMPRLDTPRAVVPRGSVAIANRQTAVYPAPTPGGWNLLGLCPTPMFDPGADPGMPVKVGDTVLFHPVSRSDYIELGGQLP